MSTLRPTLFVALFLAVSCAAPTPREPLPLGTLVILDKTDADALWFDLDGAQELRRAPTGTGPHEVACRGELAVVCDYGEQVPGSTLTVLDTRDGRLVRKIELGHKRPHGIEWLDERHVLVTSETSEAVLKVDVLAGEVAAVLPTGAKLSHMLCLAPDRSRVYTTNMGSDTASVIDLATGALLAQVPTGKGPEALDVSPDGKFLWVGDRAADTLTVIDTEKLERVATLPCAKFPIRLKFTRDGRHVLVSCAQSGDLAIFDARSRRELRRIPMELTPTDRAAENLLGHELAQSPVPIGIFVHPTEPVAWIANTNADLVTELSLDSWTVTRRIPTGRQPDGLGHVPAR
ncbi:MAG: beta-propeller fold lactonase family protein [Planctomycetaceae bacterium]|nr:beta-propeller fold lactonase family protein [Planctomycetaceae bacterium]